MNTNNKIKVLYIDPWYADKSNLYYYSSGLTSGIGKHCELTVICAKNCNVPNDANYIAKKVFFPLSNKIKRGKFRKLVRGIEYLLAYKKIKRMAKNGKYDVIHIEWLLFYKFDLRTLTKLKKYTKLLVLKAHNVLPHVNGTKYIDILSLIYKIPDIVLVHGENLALEFKHLFNDCSYKIRIQYHGVYLNHILEFDEQKIESVVKEKVNSFDRRFIFFGGIEFGKGVDRLVNIWQKEQLFDNVLLIIAGRVGSIDVNSLVRLINNKTNILFINGFIEDNLLNYLISKSNMVLLPYREGSMSGVAFTAAEFSKPILATKFGSIDEYVIDDYCGFISENDELSYAKKLKAVSEKYSNKDLELIGSRFKNHLETNFDWDRIGTRLVEEVFLKELKIKS